MAEREKRQIGHALFWYTDVDGVERVAVRGDTVSLTTADIDRGNAHQAFVVEGSAEQADLTYDPKKASPDDVLAYVGQDPVRASDALEYENAKSRPRKTLVKELEAIANPEGDADTGA